MVPLKKTRSQCGSMLEESRAAIMWVSSYDDGRFDVIIPEETLTRVDQASEIDPKQVLEEFN